VISNSLPCPCRGPRQGRESKYQRQGKGRATAGLRLGREIENTEGEVFWACGGVSEGSAVGGESDGEDEGSDDDQSELLHRE
jgi:hypothetical protein